MQLCAIFLCGVNQVNVLSSTGAPLQLESLMFVSGVQRPTYLPAFPIKPKPIGLSPNRSYGLMEGSLFTSTYI